MTRPTSTRADILRILTVARDEGLGNVRHDHLVQTIAELRGVPIKRMRNRVGVAVYGLLHVDGLVVRAAKGLYRLAETKGTA